MTNFIYNDLNIRYLYGYLIMTICAFFLVVKYRTCISLSRYGIWFWLLIIPCVLFTLAPNSNKAEHTTIAIMISMAVFGVMAVLYTTDRQEINRFFKWVNLVAVVISLYVIIIKLYPNVYWDFIYPKLGPYVQEMANNQMRKGYGVPIGGSSTYADYVIIIPLFYFFASLFFDNQRKSISSLSFIKIIIFFVAILFENRKSEIIAFVITILCLYIMSLDVRKGKAFIKKIICLLMVMLFVILALMILHKTGHLTRYDDFFQKLTYKNINSQDYSGGRLALWDQAWNLFKENPILGIGWEQFMTQNKYNHDVHNTYLQWLCETGVVGFILIFTPMIHIFLITFRNVRKMMRHKISEQSDNLIIGVVGLGMQLFFLLVNIIDPAFYHLNFFCFFCITIILSESSFKFHRQSVICSNRYPV